MKKFTIEQYLKAIKINIIFHLVATIIITFFGLIFLNDLRTPENLRGLYPCSGVILSGTNLLDWILLFLFFPYVIAMVYTLIKFENKLFKIIRLIVYTLSFIVLSSIGDFIFNGNYDSCNESQMLILAKYIVIWIILVALTNTLLPIIEYLFVNQNPIKFNVEDKKIKVTTKPPNKI